VDRSYAPRRGSIPRREESTSFSTATQTRGNENLARFSTVLVEGVPDGCPPMAARRISHRRASRPGLPGEDDCRGHLPRFHQDLDGTAAARPGPRTLAADRRPADPPPRGFQLRRRHLDRRHHAQTVPAALRRLRRPVAVRDLPRQPRRLRRIGLLHRPARRHLPGRPRHRLRPLPQRPHRLGPDPRRASERSSPASARNP